MCQEHFSLFLKYNFRDSAVCHYNECISAIPTTSLILRAFRLLPLPVGSLRAFDMFPEHAVYVFCIKIALVCDHL